MTPEPQLPALQFVNKGKRAVWTVLGDEIGDGKKNVFRVRSLKIKRAKPGHHLVQPERPGDRRLGAGEAT
jgi:hypothetical protein